MATTGTAAQQSTEQPSPRPPSRKGRKAQVRDAAAAPVARRQYRQTVTTIDLWSVLKVALCFYLAAFAVLMVAGIVLWIIASAFGVVENIEEFMGELLSSDDFQFLSRQILQGALLIGLVVVALAVIVTVVATAFYNLFAELVGGVEVTVVEEEPVPPTP